MTDDRTIPQRLASARTEDEEREALWAAAEHWLPFGHPDYWRRCQVTALLDGPRAGRIGVAVMMVPDGWWWEVKLAPHRRGARGTLWNADVTCGMDAALPSCALALAALEARAP